MAASIDIGGVVSYQLSVISYKRILIVQDFFLAVDPSKSKGLKERVCASKAETEN